MSSAQLYGGTRTLFEGTLGRFGVSTTFVPGTDPAAFAAAIGPTTKCVYTELIANPSGAVADLEGLAAVAHDAGLPLVVDSTTATPYLCRPMEWGADLVLHSATKFLGGHGTSLGGVVVESGLFDWGNGNFPAMTEPVASYGGLTWWGNFGEFGFLTRLRAEQLRDVGPALSPFNAFLLLQGVETLPQRMDAHLENTRAVVDFLQQHPAVAWVCWPGTPDHPDHERAAALPAAGAGSHRVVRRGRWPRRRPAVRGVGAAVQPPGQHRRRADARHPPRPRRPTSSSTTTPSPPAASVPTSCASPSASRTPTTSAGTSTRR